MFFESVAGARLTLCEERQTTKGDGLSHFRMDALGDFRECEGAVDLEADWQSAAGWQPAPH
jgi:hypothetical protein